MTEEEKQALEAQNAQDEDSAEADNAEGEEESNQDSDNAGDNKDDNNEADMAELLAKEREARKKAEEALAKKRFEAAEKKRKNEESQNDDDESDDKPLSERQLREILAQERQETEKRLEANRAEEIARSLSTSETEKELTLEIYRSRTFPSYYSLEEKLEEALVIANRKKLLGERNEALRALKNKSNVNRGSANTYRDAQPVGEPKIAPQDAQAIKDAGFTWNGTTRRFEKKLPNGDIIARDSKTKQTVYVKGR